MIESAGSCRSMLTRETGYMWSRNFDHFLDKFKKYEMKGVGGARLNIWKDGKLNIFTREQAKMIP